MPLNSHRDTTLATDAHAEKSAVRALDDPVKLARAARIVRAALERGVLTHADIDPEDDGHAAAG